MEADDVKRAFGSVVKLRRTRQGLSQEALAERASLHRTYITDIERGTRNLTLESISKLARALGISMRDFFPADPPVAATGARPPAAVQDLVDILLVEDSANDVELTLEAFNKARFTNRVHVVHDGEAAIDFLFCQGAYRGRSLNDLPAAILLDLNLPKLHGLDVLRRIKSEKRLRDSKVIVLSGSRRDEHIREAMQLGAAGYIVKPVDFQNFAQITPKLDFWWSLLRPNMNSQQYAAASQIHA